MTKTIIFSFLFLFYTRHYAGAYWETSGLGQESTMKKMLNLPLAIPKNVLNFASMIAGNIIKLELSAIKMPFNAGRKGISLAQVGLQAGKKNVMNIGLKINSLNADVIAGIIKKIKALARSGVQTITDIDISGFETGFKVGNWVYKSVEGIIGGVIKLIIWIMVQISNIADGSYRVMHIKQILSMPGIKYVVAAIQKVRQWNTKQLYDICIESGNFIGSIIDQHQDFFIPIFHKIFKIILIITNALQQLADGGENTGINATLGKIHLYLGPLKFGNWKISGIGEKTIGKGSVEGEIGMSNGGSSTAGNETDCESSSGSGQKDSDDSSEKSAKGSGQNQSSKENYRETFGSAGTAEGSREKKVSSDFSEAKGSGKSQSSKGDYNGTSGSPGSAKGSQGNNLSVKSDGKNSESGESSFQSGSNGLSINDLVFGLNGKRSGKS